MDALAPANQRKDTDKENTFNNACGAFMKALLQTGISMEEAKGLFLEELVNKLAVNDYNTDNIESDLLPIVGNPEDNKADAIESDWQGRSNPDWRNKRHSDEYSVYIGTLVLYNPISRMFM